MADKKEIKPGVEDVASWLARETGHVPEVNEEAHEGYEPEEETGFGLPNAKHEKLRRFFDGLHIEKELTARRRAAALEPMDEAEQMNQALKGSLPTPNQEGPIQ